MVSGYLSSVTLLFPYICLTLESFLTAEFPIPHRTHRLISQPTASYAMKKSLGCKLLDQVRDVTGTETTPHPSSSHIGRVRFGMGKQILTEHHTQVYPTVWKLPLLYTHSSTALTIKSVAQHPTASQIWRIFCVRRKWKDGTTVIHGLFDGFYLFTSWSCPIHSVVCWICRSRVWRVRALEEMLSALMWCKPHSYIPDILK
jgi:hypothetical protein